MKYLFFLLRRRRRRRRRRRDPILWVSSLSPFPLDPRWGMNDLRYEKHFALHPSRRKPFGKRYIFSGNPCFGVNHAPVYFFLSLPPTPPQCNFLHLLLLLPLKPKREETRKFEFRPQEGIPSILFGEKTAWALMSKVLHALPCQRTGRLFGGFSF